MSGGGGLASKAWELVLLLALLGFALQFVVGVIAASAVYFVIAAVCLLILSLVYKNFRNW